MRGKNKEEDDINVKSISFIITPMYKYVKPMHKGIISPYTNIYSSYIYLAILKLS